MTDDKTPHDIHFEDQFNAAASEATNQMMALLHKLENEKGKNRVTSSTNLDMENTPLGRALEHWWDITIRHPDDTINCHHWNGAIDVVWGGLGIPSFVGCHQCTEELIHLTQQISLLLTGGVKCDTCGNLMDPKKGSGINVMVNYGLSNLHAVICLKCAKESGYGDKIAVLDEDPDD